MTKQEEKRGKLAQVAKMYYVEDMKQSDIAKIMGISRPFVSRMLQEARDQRVVEIIIHEPQASQEQVFAQLRERYGIKGGMFVQDGENDNQTNRNLSKCAIEMLNALKTKRLGLGWGHLIGEMVSYLEEQEQAPAHVHTVCPLIGNAGVPVRHYQSSENVRVFAHTLHAMPHFFNLPALPGDMEEKQLFCNTESYRSMENQWGAMDTVFVNIGNYPSTPDFASGARYGTLLQKEKACGRLIAYFVNAEGKIIQSDQDFALQIPVETLRNCKNVVGVCSANVGSLALHSALKTGLFTHLVARQELAMNTLKNV